MILSVPKLVTLPQCPNNNFIFHSILLNDFYLTHREKSSLDKYYILHWSGSYLKAQMNPPNDWRSEGVITHQDVKYIVILPDFLRKSYYKQDQLKLSFRKPKAEFNIPPYVLVRLINSAN